MSQYNKFVGIARKQYALSEAARDILRHTFVSNHVQAFGSFAKTAIESGNSEGIIRKHYYARVSEVMPSRLEYPSADASNEHRADGEGVVGGFSAFPFQ